MFESRYDGMLRHFSVLQQRALTAEHGRQLSEVGSVAAATELERMTKLHLAANAHAGAVKQKLRAAEDELLEARQRAAEQQRHAHVLQRERERLNDLVTEVRRQMKDLKRASASASAAYNARRSAGAAAAACRAAERPSKLEFDPLAFSATARWTGSALARHPEDALAPPASVPASPGAVPSTPPFSKDAGAARLSGARTAEAQPAGREAHSSDGSARKGRPGYMSPREVNSVRTTLFGTHPGPAASPRTGSARGASAADAGGDGKAGGAALEPQDDAFVSVRPQGLAPGLRFRNWELASTEEREVALRSENGELLLALQLQLQRCGHLEQTLAQLRAENTRLKYTGPRPASASCLAPSSASASASAARTQPNEGAGAATQRAAAGTRATTPRSAAAPRRAQ
ncbi:hypothetical protein T492DRAFT_986562 [Pavlovales sp. CCMP2436]|nr:hypothetical protein T492DRAFT_986562 [Pavlovales sp. CCMP2436]